MSNTLRETAETCGVSVQALRKWCAKNNVSKGERGYIITDDVRERAIAYYKGKREKTKPVSESVSNDDGELATLRKQVERKDAQLAEKDAQISSLLKTISSLTETNTALLESNKALSAANAIHTAADKKEALLVVEQEHQEPQKLSRWQRLVRAWRG